MQTVPDMSDFELPPSPDQKDPVSVRMPRDLKAKVLWTVELWREMARAQGASAKTVKDIDFPYVLLRLLGGRTDEELHQWGGFPDTEEKKAAQLKAVRAAAKKTSK